MKLVNNKWPLRPRVLLSGMGFLLLLVYSVGCSSNTEKNEAANDKKEIEVAAPVEEKPDPEAIWNELIKKAAAHLQADELDETEQQIAELGNVYQDPDAPTEEEQAAVDDLKNQLAERRKALAAEQRAADLAEAEELMNRGKLTEATKKLNNVLAISPTSEQRQAVREMSARIDELRRARRDMQFWVRLLGTENRKDIVGAQNELLRKPEIALGMMLEAAEDVEQPILAANALEVLRLLNQPEVTLPAMIDVLRRSEQPEVWPAAVREIVLTRRPGAGQPLLELALSAGLAEQRAAALTALTQVIDPPNNTVVELLPLIHKDGPELSAALSAAAHAMRMHRQFDLAVHRGLEKPLTAEQEVQLAQLPERLAKLLELPADDEATAEVARAARVLAVATRQLTPQPLADVKVRHAEAEAADAPAAAVLDGVWNSVEPATMWRHPVNSNSVIVLDLGQSRTVSGVRIWNFNEASGAQRGWKEVDVYVSDSETELEPTARGIVPIAPGAADTPDYSTLVPVPFARGRYVRLQAAELWTSDSHTGLSEIQVLGF